MGQIRPNFPKKKKKKIQPNKKNQQKTSQNITGIKKKNAIYENPYLRRGGYCNFDFGVYLVFFSLNLYILLKGDGGSTSL